ncbi:MAG TPA: protein kinase [Thermoanaerobaculia bacterium]|nr:protein kinase [Thermoanaerobaculia bacterium]
MILRQPQRIGPYRIEGRIGSGGMGEVYEAYDERLDRQVAIKLIRRESAEDPRARERFRREARSAAGLNHPAIVHIYDIVESEDGDAIVMERVRGTTLARLLEPGPLPLARALRLGREIAEGLAAAHERGIVHRDLKAENVMVTDSGHAKILDFGVAKRLLRGDEVTLSVAGVVVGSYHSMSPEQARGLDVDHRSDLFSLGALLYEMLAGRPPFAGRSALDILTAICTQLQTPLQELRPDVPDVVSKAVDSLLEKDPARRPQSALAVLPALEWPATPDSGARTVSAAELPTIVEAPPGGSTPATLPPGSRLPPAERTSARATVAPRRAGRRRRLALAFLVATALVAIGLGVALRLRAREPQRLYVAVPRPVIAAGQGLPGVDLLASGLRVALLRGLLSVSGISPLAPEQVDPVPGPPAAVARAAAADEVVTARLECGAVNCQISLSRILGKDGSLLWTESFEAPVDQPFLLAEAAQGRLQAAYPDRRPRQDLPRLEVRAEDYTEYLRLRRELDEKQDVDPLLERLAALRLRSPRFLEALILEAVMLRERFGARRDAADLDRAVAVLNQARALAPTDPRPLLALFEIAWKGERLGQAEEAVGELERLLPADPEVQTARARLLERRGDREQALTLMRAAALRRPSWFCLSRLVDMEYRLGESAGARRDLQTLLDRFPGYYWAESMRAQIELNYGSPEEAVTLYTRLVTRSPRPAEVGNLGTALLLLKRYPEAEARFRQALTLAPDNPLVLLNLADAQLLAGQKKAAETLYRRLPELVARDPAAANWQLQSVRAQALAHLGDRRRAVEGAQQVFLAAQGNGEAAYQAALVYTLVGDLSSAQVDAERALRQGIEARWFTLPWFDPLRATPEFQALLKPRPPA